MAPSRHHHSHHHQHHGHHGHQSGSGGASGGNAFGPSGGVGQASIALNGGHDSSATGLPPAPHRVDATQAQTYRLQDAYWSDEEEDMDCPLCLEEIDISDANFKPCPCGYQICRFCWHHIKENLNGRCPACRRKYSDTMVEFKPMSQEEIKRLAQAKKQKEREKRELEQMNRKHLANMRVVQKNLVYVVGMDPKLAREELIPTLRSNEYFGQYGRISKILISKRTTASKLVMGTQESSIGVYVTYVRKEDAARAIIAIDGSKGSDGRTVRASYGTTKYCTTYLRNLPCSNPICTYLHEPGEEADSFTKEDLTTLRHAAKDAEGRPRAQPVASTTTSFHAATRPYELHSTATGVGFTSGPGGGGGGGGGATTATGAPSAQSAGDASEASALPKTASWASGGKPISTTSAPSQNSAIRDSDLPPLSALANASVSRKNSSQRAPGSPITVKTSARGRAQQARSESPAPPRSETASPVPPPPPGLAKGPSALSQGSPSLQNRASVDNEESTPQALQTSLSKHGAPPGLSSRSGTPSGDTASSASEPKTASNYQPSSNAQAVLDDMRARREAEATQPIKSPFPDFDATLSSFRDGDDFCFTLEESLLPAHIRNAGANGETGSGLGNAFTSFSSASLFAGLNGLQAGAAASSSATPPPPGLGRAASGAGVEPQTYSGSFDPFAPGAGEKLPDGLSGTANDNSPFATIDEMRRTLSEERGPTAEEREDEENSASRFGFAKRKESFKTSDDLLGFIRSGALMTSNVQQQEYQTQFSNNVNNDNATSDANSKANDWLLGGLAQQQFQQQRAAQFSSLLPLQGNLGGFGQQYTTDRSYFGSGGGNGNASGTGQSSTPGADSILLAQLMNRKPNETLPYNDPAIMSYTRQQQQQQQQQQAFANGISQQPFGSSTFNAGAFNPFDGAQSMQYHNGIGVGANATNANANGNNGPASAFQQQPSHQSQQSYGGHRTFARLE